MHRLLASIAVFCFGFGISASADGLTVRTTTRMLSDPMAFLFDGQAEVSALLGAGTDPHTYQPTRKDVRGFVEADAVAYHGLLFEAQLLGLMKQLEGRKPVGVAAKFQPEDQLLFAEGVEDPHTWHDPILWVDTIVSLSHALAEELGVSVAVERVALLQEAAALTDAWIKDAFASTPQESRIIVSAHDAFQYYGTRYGLRLEPLLGLSTTSETKLARVNELVALIEAEGLSAVFSETSVESAGIAALREGAARRGVDLRALPPLFSDALGPDGEEGSTYFGMLIENTVNMVDAVSGQRPEPAPALVEFLDFHGLMMREAAQ
jgi:manganese/zinc/iron transport system substrate-binding protein